MKKRSYFLISLPIIFFTSLIFANWFSTSKKFSCIGKYKTLFLELPLNLKIQNNLISWEIELPNNNVFDMWNDGLSMKDMKDLLVELDALTVFYAKRENINFGVKFSDKVFVEEIDKNKLLVQWGWVEGTFIKDKCLLEMPIEVDTLEKGLEYYPF
tara:strand:+ start:390 stop:857 length:468 start_codon:yes stop_codon:yes gene_type:complete